MFGARLKDSTESTCGDRVYNTHMCLPSKPQALIASASKVQNRAIRLEILDHTKERAERSPKLGYFWCPPLLRLLLFGALLCHLALVAIVLTRKLCLVGKPGSCIPCVSWVFRVSTLLEVATHLQAGQTSKFPGSA